MYIVSGTPPMSENSLSVERYHEKVMAVLSHPNNQHHHLPFIRKYISLYIQFLFVVGVDEELIIDLHEEITLKLWQLKTD